MAHQTNNDGDALYGAREINIAGNVFTFENFEPSWTSTEIVQTNHLNVPIKKVHIPQVGTASGVCALKPNNVQPYIGQTTAAVDGVSWIVTEVGKPEVKDGIKMVSCSFSQKLN
jgi:hypothetical protein